MAIGVIDVGVSNLGSLCGALSYIGQDALLVRNAVAVNEVSHLILPGVGAFPEFLGRLKDRDLYEFTIKLASRKFPILGICLGMQALVETGTENHVTSGLGLINGEVLPLPSKANMRVPHVGWNSVNFHCEHPVFTGLKSGVDFYFVHGFYVQLKNYENLVASCGYSVCFPAAIASGNIVGVQFHPEKSQSSGLRILRNFCNWDGSCSNAG